MSAQAIERTFAQEEDDNSLDMSKLQVHVSYIVSNNATISTFVAAVFPGVV
jgi:hypothetical protein